MSEPKDEPLVRYDLEIHNGRPFMVRSPNGTYVEYKDIEARTASTRPTPSARGYDLSRAEHDITGRKIR